MSPSRRLLLAPAVALSALAVAAPAFGDGGWVHLGAPRRLALTAAAYAPRFSPDGRELLVSGERLRGLGLAPLAGGTVRHLVDAPGAGVEARFGADGRVAFRAFYAGERRELQVDRLGVVTAAAVDTAPAVVARDDRIYVRGPAGDLRSIATGDRFFALARSPDGRRAAFVGLATGIYVYDLGRRALLRVGPGTAPAWSPDGRLLVFERTEDDGHALVASDLYAFEPFGRGLSRLTATDRLLERRPAISADGALVAFDDDAGGVHVARLEVAR